MPFCSSSQWNSSKYMKWKGCWYGFFGSCVVFSPQFRLFPWNLISACFSSRWTWIQNNKYWGGAGGERRRICGEFVSVLSVPFCGSQKALCQDFQWALCAWTVLFQHCSGAFCGLRNCGNGSHFGCAKLHLSQQAAGFPSKLDIKFQQLFLRFYLNFWPLRLRSLPLLAMPFVAAPSHSLIPLSAFYGKILQLPWTGPFPFLLLFL